MAKMNISNFANIREHVYFNSKKIEIGKCFINRDVKFYSSKENVVGGKITIQDNVAIGPGATICCISHEIGSINCRAGKHTDKDIVVEKGSWIGAEAIILPGVKIGRGCVIGAGAVVTKDCEANGLYVGNPAKKIKNLEEE